MEVVMKQTKLRTLVECALMVALAIVLGMIVIYEGPFGGSVTLFSMVPLLLISFRHGMKWGLGCCFVYSVVNVFLGIKNLTYIPTPAGVIATIFLDYIIAFTVIGIAGMTRNIKITKNDTANSLMNTFSGSLAALIIRFICHLVSGAVIWYSLTQGWYAEDPTHIVHQYGPWMYSLVYNATFMVPEIALTLVATPVLVRLLSIIPKKTR